MGTEIVKINSDLILSKTKDKEYENLNQYLIQLGHTERKVAIEIAQKEIEYQYPTMVNPEAYQLAIQEGRVKIKDDFDLTIPGKIRNEDGSYSIPQKLEDTFDKIISDGGIGPRYESAIDIQSKFRHWKKFWYLLEEYETNGTLLPDFEYKLEHIELYAFQILREPEVILSYLNQLKLKLLYVRQDKDNYPQEMQDYIISKLDKLISELKKSLTINKSLEKK